MALAIQIILLVLFSLSAIYLIVFGSDTSRLVARYRNAKKDFKLYQEQYDKQQTPVKPVPAGFYIEKAVRSAGFSRDVTRREVDRAERWHYHTKDELGWQPAFYILAVFVMVASVVLVVASLV